MHSGSRIPLFFLVMALLAPALAVAAAPSHGHAATPAAASAAPASRFDEKSALALSQAAIGKPLNDYTFTAADGRRVKLSDYRGRPLVISLIYTSCYHICPTTTQHLAKIARTARAALGPESFRIVTIGFDTPNDSPAAMQRFARDQGVEGFGDWDFLSADATTMQSLMRDLGFIAFSAAHGFDHLIQATVVDAQGKIYRQVYGMTFDTPLLVEPLKELVFGTPAAHSLFTGLGNRIKLFCTVYDPATDSYRFDYSLFIEFAIGLSFIGTVSFFLVREWLRNRRRRA